MLLSDCLCSQKFIRKKDPPDDRMAMKILVSTFSQGKPGQKKLKIGRVSEVSEKILETLCKESTLKNYSQKNGDHEHSRYLDFDSQT